MFGKLILSSYFGRNWIAGDTFFWNTTLNGEQLLVVINAPQMAEPG
jgi:hypothetical protein